jgi:hypothetical protein
MDGRVQRAIRKAENNPFSPLLSESEFSGFKNQQNEIKALCRKREAESSNRNPFIANVVKQSSLLICQGLAMPSFTSFRLLRSFLPL